MSKAVPWAGVVIGTANAALPIPIIPSSGSNTSPVDNEVIDTLNWNSVETDIINAGADIIVVGNAIFIQSNNHTIFR